MNGRGAIGRNSFLNILAVVCLGDGMELVEDYNLEPPW